MPTIKPRACRNFRLNDRYRHGEEANAQTLDGAASDESIKTRSKHLHKGGPEVDKCSNAHASLAANDISESTGDESADCCRDLINSVRIFNGHLETWKVQDVPGDTKR
jgi:hypothetical protein